MTSKRLTPDARTACKQDLNTFTTPLPHLEKQWDFFFVWRWVLHQIKICIWLILREEGLDVRNQSIYLIPLPRNNNCQRHTWQWQVRKAQE